MVFRLWLMERRATVVMEEQGKEHGTADLYRFHGKWDWVPYLQARLCGQPHSEGIRFLAWPHPFETAAETGSQMFRHPSLWETFYILHPNHSNDTCTLL